MKLNTNFECPAQISRGEEGKRKAPPTINRSTTAFTHHPNRNKTLQQF
jgi:hypothetical protein